VAVKPYSAPRLLEDAATNGEADAGGEDGHETRPQEAAGVGCDSFCRCRHVLSAMMLWFGRCLNAASSGILARARPFQVGEGEGDKEKVECLECAPMATGLSPPLLR